MTGVRVLLAVIVVLVLVSPAQAWIPNDSGLSGVPGGWRADQWNFMPFTGVDAPRAWDNLIAAGRPGGLGLTVAVLHTGLAYEDRGRFRRSAEVSRARLAPGRDFCPYRGGFLDPCAGQDAHPDDDNGHGTHVAATIPEGTENPPGETRLAYGATIMPVRVLDRRGKGDEGSIAAGVRYAARRGAQVIN